MHARGRARCVFVSLGVFVVWTCMRVFRVLLWDLGVRMRTHMRVGHLTWIFVVHECAF